ncbi:MAG TPA: response regulator transcription factor [Chitinophagaceae bacterium]|nr:response regulator transcription factor [Chitinophagaceae bacterium]
MNDIQQISVILVDDHPVVMEGLRSLLEKNEMLDIVGAFTTGKATLNFLENHEVNVILLDISLPDRNGTALCSEIKEKYPRVCILAISNHDEHSIITEMLRNGASGYLLKNASSKELTEGIQQAIEGELVFSDEVKKILAKGSSSAKPLPKLTRREKEVLKWVAEGMTTTSIAEKLIISPLTVETHRRNLMQKLKVNNTAALIRVAAKHELI